MTPAVRFSAAVRIAEIVRRPPLTPLPGLPAWLPGLAVVRGRLFSVVDLGRWLGVTAASDPEPGYLTLLEAAGSDEYGGFGAVVRVAVTNNGGAIEVTYVNNLPAGGGGNRGNNLLEVDTCAHGPNNYGDSKRVVTHLHGGHVPARYDGQPEYHILPGETDIYEYPNNQEAGTVWYHDHALGITRLNVYAGMAGFYFVRDEFDTPPPAIVMGGNISVLIDFFLDRIAREYKRARFEERRRSGFG